MKATSAALLGGAIATVVAWGLGEIGHQPPQLVVASGQTIWTFLVIWISGKPWQITPAKP